MNPRALGRSTRVASIALILASLAGAVHAGTISLAWDSLSHPDLVGYRVYYGTVSGNYTQTLDVGLTTQATLNNLNNCTTYYVAVKGRSTDGSESSLFSNEISGWARPELQSASPGSVERASQVNLTINGANFVAGSTVQFSDPSIVVNSVSVSSCTQIVANITVPATANLGGIGVTVLNPDQVFGAASSLFNVVNAAPDGQIDQPSSAVSIAAGDTVQFAGSGSDPDNNTPLSFQWSFGDPSIPDSNQQNPGAVQFNNAGTYQVTLTVTDSLGAADASPASVTVTVSQAQPPVITNIQAATVGSTTATITWTTDKPSDSQVLYRRVGDGVFQQTAVASALVTSHSVSLIGLRPATTYEYQVRSADSGGLTSTQAAGSPFTTQTNSFSYIRIEAESGPIVPPAETVSDSSAFRGAYIRLASGTSPGNANNPSGTWDFGFHTQSGGTWYVWYRMYGQNNNSNTWLERVDGAGFQSITPSTNSVWQWVAGRSYTLGAGSHVLTLGGAESLARMDRMLITDDPNFTPTEAPNGDTTPPARVLGLSAVPGDTVNTLSWTNPSEAGPFRVIVRYSTGGSHPLHPSDGLPLADIVGTAGAAETLSHTGLTNGTSYLYSVFVVDGSDNASDPATAQATPESPTTPLGQVQNLRRTDKAN